MGAKGMVSFIAIALLLFPLAAATMDSENNLEEMMNDETLEQLFINCGAEFTHSEEPLQDLQSNGVDQDIIDCLRDNIVRFVVSVEDKHIRRRNDVPIRRKLVEINCEPHRGKEHEHDHSYLEKDIEPVPFAVSKFETGDGGIDSTTIIIVVVSTAILTFLLATVIFCWYTRTYGGLQNDEKRMLSLSRNEVLNGSSQKHSYTLQTSVKEPVNTFDQLLGTGPDLQKKDSSVNSSVSLGIPLEPPPGILTASGIAPLKPPPGRPELALKTPPARPESAQKTHSPPNRSPVDAAPPVRVPSARQPRSARPPPPSGKAPPPPPPLKKGPVPPPPPGGARPPPRPCGPGFKSRPSSEADDPDGDDANKAKLKPFFWDKVNMANPDQAMVWSQIRAGSFQFNEEMIENLFGYNVTVKNKGNNNKKSSSQDPTSSLVQIIEPKKAQNLSILLKALNVTTNEVCDALNEGTELPLELIQTLLKMAPTGEEELKLRLYNGDMSRLGNAERFLKKLVEIPFAFKRLESLLFICTLQEEEDIMKESFQTLEAACVQLKKSRLFLKLLEAVLKTGNRMNDGTFRGSAQAFKLDTLLKLADVKGVDGKTTLLHFVVLEIIRAEGVRAAKTARETKRFSNFSSDELLEESSNGSEDSDDYYRNLGLQVVSCLSSELDDVKKAAILDAEGMTGTVSKFGNALLKAREFLNTDLKNINQQKGDGDCDDEDEFAVILSNFVQDAEKDVMWMLEEEKRIMAVVKDTADYFHGQAGKDEGLRLFVIVRDFLIILDKVCKEIKDNPLVRPNKMIVKKDVSPSKQTEKKDILSSETKDDSEPRITQTEDDVSSPTTHENDDVQHDKTVQNEDLKHAKQEIEDQKHETSKTEVAYTLQGTDHLVHHGTQETDDSKHATQEGNDLEPRTVEEDGLQHKIHETDDSQHKTHETDDLQPESQNKDVEETSGRTSDANKTPFRAPHERLIPAIAMRRMDTFSSDSSSDDD